MTADFPTLTVPAPAPVRSRKHLTVASLLAFLTLGLMAAFPSHALDLVAFVGIGGPLAAACDVAIVVPHAVTARIQEAHILVGHALCDGIERRLGL